MEPALRVDRLRRLLGVLVVADEPRRPAHEDLAGRVRRQVLARLGVDDRGAPSRGTALPFVVSRVSSGSVGAPDRDEAAAFRAAERGDLRHGTAAAPAMIRSVPGEPTAITSRSALRSASAKRGSFWTASQIVSNAGKASVQRSRSSMLERDVGIEAAADMDERARRRDAWRGR